MSSFMPTVTPLEVLLGFSGTLGHTLLMDTQNKVQMLTDTAQTYGDLMLSVVLGEGAWQGHSCY